MARGPGAYPMIDLRNVATCLACPVPGGCVYEVADLEIRRLCPIWRREVGQQTRYKQRQAARRGQAEAATGG